MINWLVFNSFGESVQGVGSGGMLPCEGLPVMSTSVRKIMRGTDGTISRRVPTVPTRRVPTLHSRGVYVSDARAYTS